MPVEVTMPRLSDTMEQGTLNKWRVKPGQKVTSGMALADIETDKATMELQAFDDGVVAELSVKEGEIARVGSRILVLATGSETAADALAKVGPAKKIEKPAEAPKSAPKATPAPVRAIGSGTPVASSATPVTTAAAPAPATPAAPGRKIRTTPIARRLADENGLDLTSITGTGPSGRIIKSDILKALENGSARKLGSAAASKPAKPEGPTIPAPKPLQARVESVTAMRQTIARRLLESKTTIPHFTVTIAIDADPILQVRQQINSMLGNQGFKLSVNDFIVRGVAMALQRHPNINSSWSDDGIVYHGTVNVGVAVALPAEKGGGLVVPTLHNAHTLSVQQISDLTRKLATKARGQGLTIDEMSDGTFTISNLGMFGIEHFEAIINPPQSAILAVGAALEKVVARKGEIVVGHEMQLTLSADHRVIDGAQAAEFLTTLRHILEHPAATLVGL